MCVCGSNDTLRQLQSNTQVLANFLMQFYDVYVMLFTSFIQPLLLLLTLQWGTVDAEIKDPSVENLELKSSPFM